MRSGLNCKSLLANKNQIDLCPVWTQTDLARQPPLVAQGVRHGNIQRWRMGHRAR